MDRSGFRSSFKDKKGRFIREGDILIKRFDTVKHDNPYGKKVAYDGMGNERIVPDQGKEWKESAWIKYQIKWIGDCLIAEKIADSGNLDYPPSAFEYLNNAFRGREYEICEEHEIQHKD